MSCTIFYKGKLKEDTTIDALSSIIKEQISKINCSFHQDDNCITVIFNAGNSEPLVFDFDNAKVDNFCKWNGEDENEFYAIFDLFIAIKPLFRSLRITDDEGAWEEYLAKSKPCKIKLRPLVGEIENQLLNRALKNSSDPFGEIEQIVYDALRLHSAAPVLCRIITQDFIKIIGIKSRDDFAPKPIVDFTNNLDFADDHLGKVHVQNFEHTFKYMMLRVWISHAFTYKNRGMVHQLPNNVSGLKSSKLAALFGISSIFLNWHSGIVNSKHTEMNKFADLHYMARIFGTMMFGGDEVKELELFVSMIDYLHFKYVGV